MVRPITQGTIAIENIVFLVPKKKGHTTAIQGPLGEATASIRMPREQEEGLGKGLYYHACGDHLPSLVVN